MLIKSLKQFISELERISLDIYKNKNERVYYRGESKDFKDNKLVPKVFRTDGETGKRLFDEQKEYSRALRHRPEEFESHMTKLDILSKMQHFDIATRLLDFTTNPLYALYFACHDFADDDGYVYIVFGRHAGDFDLDDNIIATYDDPIVTLISNFPSLSEDELNIYHKGLSHLAKNYESVMNLNPKPNFLASMEKHFRHDGNPDSMFHFLNGAEYNAFQNVQLKLSSKVTNEFPLFTNLEIHPAEILNSYFVKPQYTNPNIQKQQGLFYLNGLKKTKIKPNYTFKISKDYKMIILAELKLFAGIDSTAIFSGLRSVADINKDKIFKAFLDSIKNKK